MIVAISGEGEFIDRVENSSFRGFVHSVFKRTINIQNLESKELFTVACRKIDNGPNTLIIDIEDFSGIIIEENDRVSAANKIISIGDKLHISIDKCQKWESLLPEFPAQPESVTRNLKVVKDHIAIHGKGGGAKPDLTTDHIFAKEVSRMLEEKSLSLQHELILGKPDNALQYAVSLIGLGPGLTPSGDDFLVGMLAAMNMKNSPFSSYQPFFEELANKAKTLTNDISYMAILKASIGKVRESIIELVDAIVNDSDENIILSLNKVLNIGSSSGTDIALGLVCGLETNIKAGGKL